MATYVKTEITDVATDEDSPGTETLFQDMGQSINYLIDAAFSGATNSEPVMNNLLAGDFLLHANDTQVDRGLDAGWGMAKETQVVRAGTYRIKFDLVFVSGAGSVQGRIYVNDSPVGIERSRSSSGTTTFSEDISGIAAEDLVQIYSDDISSVVVGIKNFRLYTTFPQVAVPITKA